MNEILELSAGALVRAYRDGELSPVAVMQAVLEQVRRLDDQVNAFRTLDEDGALQAAQESEHRWRQGIPRGLLEGVPVSVKDMVATRGMSTLFGSRTLPNDFLADRDAPSIELLKQAGAVVFGKTTTSEFGNKIVGDSPLTGVTRNPWNLDRTAGGSSCGAGAALAARMGPLAVGTDGGGSIRVPSAWNGVCGIKPSFKRVPTLDMENVGEVSNVGPMAREVRDLARMLTVMSGPCPRDWQQGRTAHEDFEQQIEEGVRGLRLVFSRNLGMIEVEKDIATHVGEAAYLLQQQGARITWVDELAPLKNYLHSEMHSILWIARCEHLVRHTPEELRAHMDPEILDLAERGRQMPAARLMEAMMARLRLASEMHAFFADHDALLCPTFHCSPPRAPGLPSHLRMAPPFTSWCNQTQQPAASVPCGLNAEGLPIGLQVIGPRFSDGLVLRIGRAYERARGAFPMPPLCRSMQESQP